MNSWKRTFAIIWTGQFFSLLTSSIVNFAIILWLSLETGSASVLAVASIFALLPQAVLGLFTGVFVDRWNRKRTMIIADASIAFFSFLLAILFYLGEVQIWHTYILLSLRSAGSAFHAPAMQASVPLIAPKEELMRVSGMSQMINSISYIAGPALGALLITNLSMGVVVMVDVVGAIIACTSLLFVKIPNPEKGETTKVPNIFKEMKESFFEVKKIKGLPLLFFFSILATFFMMPVSILFPLMTLNHFNGDAFQVSLIEVLWAVGMLLGGAMLSLKPKINTIVLLNLMYLVLGASFFFSGILPFNAFVIFAVLTLIGGASGAIYSSSFMVVLQTKLDPSVLGRIFSIFGSVSILPSFIGIAATGFIADVIGIPNAFAISGLIIAGIGLWSFLSPLIKGMKADFDKKADSPEEPAE